MKSTADRLRNLILRCTNSAMASRASERIYNLAQRKLAAGNVDAAEGLTYLANALHYRKNEINANNLSMSRNTADCEQDWRLMLQVSLRYFGS